MKALIFIPASRSQAVEILRAVDHRRLAALTKPQFLQAWSAVAYLFPGLHPDGYAEAESGWPRSLRPIAAEAWRRASAGALADAELYPCDAQWCAIFDGMRAHTAEETQRREELAATRGMPSHA